ncbi:glycosyltransferase family 4 protein [Rhodococcus sp. 14-1411-2a]|uniref:glycosyltransferase family 4 protein n=1 Tax=Rhodococcus sp. 14-1411-2a TaxID=2023151 RepID=UPI0015C6747E|nr:glycosyltransferase family 4 protein [Rhodococcus sp. 14-1411-2a]
MAEVPDEQDASPSLHGLSVCVVACHYAPETTGSAPYNTALVEALSSAGADVNLITGVPHYPQWAIQDPRYRRGITWREQVGNVRVRRVRHAVPAAPDLVGRARMELSFATLAAPLVRASRADVVIAVTPLLGALLAASLGHRGRPLGVVVHDLSGNAAAQSGTTGGTAGRMVGSFEYRLARRADSIGVITPRFRDVLTENGVDAAKIVDLPIFTHISGSTETTREARARLGWTDTDHRVVVHTGNMGMKQGLESVVDAARMAHEQSMPITYVMVGDGNQRRQLVSAADGLPTMKFVDPVDESTYPSVLAAADVLLLNERPGVKEMSLPSKLTSYVAASRPIVAATEPGGISHSVLVEHSSALFATPGDPAALNRAVMTLDGNPVEVDRLIRAARDLGNARYSESAGREGFRHFAHNLARRDREGHR